MCNHFNFRDTFEEETDKFFTNDPNNKESKWELGTGDPYENWLKGRTPPFDHTFFTDQGNLK